MKIIVIGDGGWGTAFSLVLCDSLHEVTLWSSFPDYAQQMADTRTNPKFLPNVSIPESIRILHRNSPVTWSDYDLIINAVPTQFVRPIFSELAFVLPADIPIVSLSKGLEISTGQRVSVILQTLFPGRPILVLSGPSHAEEVARKLPTAITLAGEDHELVKELQSRLSTEYFRVYSNHDVIGVELGGAIKNVISLAAGMVDGLGFGDNTKSALITRGLAEIIRLGVILGAERDTFYGLSGLGDLITTSVSHHGRNWWCGYQIGQGKTLPQIEKETGKVIEGVYTVLAVQAMQHQHHLEMPITQQVYQVIYQDKSPRTALLELMRRSSKSE
ncbi:MAG: NAD(P)-dependent glycerol-3-phosphate dehydrogenase [Candidatus Delongbacteria bacterium]|nr:NAD(P)-dependent glycerol-3-phosphate dehydrogenase [Candidatus Delongbacteria bacterium]